MKRTLILGSVACDEVIRLSAPLQVGGHNQGFPEGRRIGGGAANTALALTRAGDEVGVISAVADDDVGRWLLATLTAEGIDTSLIQRDAEVTTHSLVLVGNEGERTIVNRRRARVTPPEPGLCRDAALLYVRSADPALSALLEACVQHCRIVAHIPPVTQGFRSAQILVGSRDDLSAGFLASPWQAGNIVAGEALQWVVITAGPEGATAYGKERTLHCAAPTVAAVDTTGAGDVFAAGLIHALARGDSLEKALETGVQWGTASVRYEGTIPPAGFPDSM